MTLKISRFLTDAFNKQAKISHFDYKIQVGKPDKMKPDWKQQILDTFGELFLNDANYVIMAKVDGSDDKLRKKFNDLCATVLDTEVPESDVKVLELETIDAKSSEDDDGEEEEEASVAVESVLLVKLTTK